MSQVKVKYVGRKEGGHTDHLYGTGKSWSAPGDVQSIPESARKNFEKHPDVYEIVEGDEIEDGLNQMTLDQLRELCTARGIEFHANSRESSLIAKLRA